MKNSAQAFLILAFAFNALTETAGQPQNATPVEHWGFIGGRTGGWSIHVDKSGDVRLSGDSALTGWSAVRGGFDTMIPTTQKAFVATGEMEFVGAGFETWSSLRYGVFYSDSAGTVVDTLPSAAFWNGTENHHSGYLFTPYSGTNDPVHWLGVGSNGSHGAVVDGNWLSTDDQNNYVLGENRQKPGRAVASAGVYNFVISIQAKGDGAQEIRFYLIGEASSIAYYFAGTSVDKHSPLTTTKFNCICFALNNNNAKVRALILRNVKVELGEPIIVNEYRPDYSIVQWGFIGGRTGGWKFTPGEFVGDATISGNAPCTEWAAVRGAFSDSVKPSTGRGLIVHGMVEFVGGGFEACNSFRFGIFYSDSAGYPIKIPVDSTRWSGTGAHHSGYLFIPPSGVRPSGVHTCGVQGPPEWPGNLQGTWGAVIDGDWLTPEGANNYVLGGDRQVPAEAVGGAGVYEFAVSVSPQDGGTNEIRFFLMKRDNGYCFAGKAMDVHHPLAAEKFNCVCFALNTNAATTAMNIYAVQIGISEPLSLPTGLEEVVSAGKPWEYALGQNYPNPFNPTTRIQYSVPKSGVVSLKVYNLLGQEVATLFEGVRHAGDYIVLFDGRSIPSGVYLVRLKAGHFSETKKMILIK
ncbi:MAG TPA: T9SS type A sorting domain-containing protein [bacterium]